MNINDFESNEEVEISYEHAKNIALRALGPRARSRKEIVELLKSKKVSDSTINFICEDLEIYGYINDLDFANQWVDSRTRKKKVSKKIIERELFLKGIDKEFIAQALADISDDSEFEMAHEIASKKYSSISHLGSDVIYRRLHSLLARKGYDMSTITKVIKSLTTSCL